MTGKDFYDIKGLGELPPEGDAEHPTPPYEPPRPYKSPKRHTNRSWRTVGIVIIIILVIAALGGGAYWFGKYHKPMPKPAATTKNSSPQPATSTTNGMAQYTAKGSDLDLSFTYPASWSVTPPSGTDTSNQTITLTSPLTSIAVAGSSTVTGKVVVTIRPATASLSELSSNTPTAAIASTQFAYTAPTANQYQYPYLTFIHFSNGASTSNAFEEVLITGTTQFNQGQAVSALTLTGLDPIIAATFTKCSTEACTGSTATPLGITSTTWQTDALFQATQKLFASMQLQ